MRRAFTCLATQSQSNLAARSVSRWNTSIVVTTSLRTCCCGGTGLHRSKDRSRCRYCRRWTTNLSVSQAPPSPHSPQTAGHRKCTVPAWLRSCGRSADESSSSARRLGRLPSLLVLGLAGRTSAGYLLSVGGQMPPVAPDQTVYFTAHGVEGFATVA